MTDAEPKTARRDPLALLYEFGVAITSSLVLEKTLGLIAQRTCEAVDAWECDLYEYSERDGTLTSTAFWAREPTPEDRDWVGTVVDIADRPAYAELLDQRQIVQDSVDDPDLPAGERELMRAWGEQTAVSVPLVFDDEVIGVLLVVEKREPRRFSDDELELLRQISVMAAIAISNARSYRRQEDRTRQLAALLDASRAIASSVVLEDVLDLVSEYAAETLHSSQCLIFEFDVDNDAVIPRSFYARTGHIDPDYEPDIGVVYPLDEYPTDRYVLAAGTPIVEQVSNPHLPEDTRQSMEMWGEKTALTIPLVFNNHPLGLLELVELDHERQYTDAEIDLACGLGEQAALAIHNARLFRRVEEQNHNLRTLLEASQVISGSLDAREVIERVISEVAGLFPGAETAAVVKLRAEGNRFVQYLDAASGGAASGGAAAGAPAAAPPDALAAQAVRSMEPVYATEDHGAQRLVVPLVLGRRAAGYLDLRCRRFAPFGDDEIQLVHVLVNHAAIALENADNYGRLESTYLDTVTALAAAMEAKDQYTAEHADMLAAMALAVGHRLGLSEGELRDLQYAAVLHDIGKIGIPGTILNKPDRLTRDEFATMAQHTIIGERIISRVHYLAPIARIIRSAHERWDGTGYPDGIPAEQIPLEARILLVCDAYHAMTSDRPYRSALPQEVALQELERNAGTQFDPGVVATFLELHPDFEAPEPETPLFTALPRIARERERER